jgi:trigger factor
LQERIAEETRQSMRDQVCQYLLESAKFEVPPGAAARHAASVLRRRFVDLLNRGVPRERIEENLAELQGQVAQQSQQYMKLTFILSKVAEQEKIEVDDAEVNARIAQMAASENRRPERLRQELETEGALEHVVESLREEKAIDKLLEQAEVTEEAEPPTEGQAPASARADQTPKPSESGT